MCTVTFIPVNRKVFLTHNRDECKLRPKASAPAFIDLNGMKVLFPKDGAAGGSWAGLNEFGHAAVLLNGAFNKHHPKPAYRKSRGLIFLDLLSSADMLQTYDDTSLDNIEPFTFICWNGNELYECRWNGTSKFITPMDSTTPYMWSSSTLYDDTVIEKRSSWFSDWLVLNPAPAADDVIRFHLEAGDGDEGNDLRMNRDNDLATLSITAIECTAAAGKMKYIDLAEDVTTSYRITFKKVVVENR